MDTDPRASAEVWVTGQALQIIALERGFLPGDRLLVGFTGTTKNWGGRVARVTAPALPGASWVKVNAQCDNSAGLLLADLNKGEIVGWLPGEMEWALKAG